MPIFECRHCSVVVRRNAKPTACPVCPSGLFKTAPFDRVDPDDLF